MKRSRAVPAPVKPSVHTLQSVDTVLWRVEVGYRQLLRAGGHAVKRSRAVPAPVKPPVHTLQSVHTAARASGAGISGGGEPGALSSKNWRNRRGFLQGLERTAAAVLAVLALGGCGRDVISDAIQRLDGPPAESKKAAMELRLMSKDPVPALESAVLARRTKSRVRLQCLEILGDIARGQNDARVFEFLRTQLRSKDPEVGKAAAKGFVGAHYESAVPELIALKKGADKDLLKRIDEALTSTSEYMVREVEKLWGSPEAAMAAYERAEKMGLDRGLMGYSKGRFLEARGRTAEAAAKFEELGLIRRWWLIGPFPNRQGMGFNHAYPPEQEVKLDAEYTDGYGKASWYELDHDLPAGMVNLENYFVETDNVVGYAAIFLVSDRDQAVEIRAGSDDTLSVFLNNETIWTHGQYRGVKFDNDVIDAKLHKGGNIAVFKVCEDWGAWMLVARVTGPGDTPLQGVAITTTPPAAPNP